MYSLINEHQLALSIVVLVLMLVAFAREIIKPSGVAVIGAAAFLLFGFVEQKELLGVFSNPAVIAIGAMLVLTQALVRTGTLEALAGQVITLSSTRPRVAVVVLMSVAMFASAFLNSTPVVVIMIPLVATLAQSIGASPKNLLIPLSYVAILGGTCTLIGTSTNLLVNSIARQNGHPGFGIFDITIVGLCAATTGILFLLLTGRWLLPSDTATKTNTPQNELVNIITEICISEDFDDKGTSYSKLALLKHRGVVVVRVERNGKRVDIRDESVLVEVDDLLVLRVSSTELVTLATVDGLQLGVKVRRLTDEPVSTERFTVLNDAPVIGRRLLDTFFVSRHPVSVIGLRRHRVLAGPDLSSLQVKAGDQIWITGTTDVIDSIVSDPYFVTSGLPPSKPFLRDRALFALLTLALVIGVAAAGWVPLVVSAVVGIGFLLAVHSLDTDDAWSALNADVLILIYAMLIVGAGLQNTGAVDAIVAGVLPLLSILPPIGIVMAVYFLTSVLTEMITNNGVAVIMTPIVIGLADGLGVSSTTLIVAVMFAASASFATPVGYQTNTLVYIAGNYRFTEFLRIGIPMNVVVGLVTSLAIAVWF